jgi:small-conductance mechanosensitive channel
MESSLQQTGFIGMILAFLAFTSAHWLPGIISGLTLMNTNHIAKGEIIKFDHKIFSVFDIGFFYTTLLNEMENSRVIIDNKSLSQKEITNLSKKASLDGLRIALIYNISYPSEKIKTEKEYDSFINNFKSIFPEIMDEAEKNKDLKVNVKSGYELFLIEAGDYALSFKFTFYLEDLKNISSTKNVRKYFATKHRLNEIIQKKAHLRGISLATPILIEGSKNKEEIVQNYIDNTNK